MTRIGRYCGNARSLPDASGVLGTHFSVSALRNCSAAEAVKLFKTNGTNPKSGPSFKTAETQERPYLKPPRQTNANQQGHHNANNRQHNVNNSHPYHHQLPLHRPPLPHPLHHRPNPIPLRQPAPNQPRRRRPHPTQQPCPPNPTRPPRRLRSEVGMPRWLCRHDRRVHPTCRLSRGA